MKSIYNYICAAVLLTTVGCTAENIEPTVTEESKQEILLTSKILDQTRTANLDEQKNHIVNGQQVGITITGASSTHNNVIWTADGAGNLSHSGDPIYYSGNQEATIVAYHPYNKYWSNVVNASYTFTVQENQLTSAGYVNSDLLWAKTTTQKSNTAVNLAFKHMLSKVEVVLTSTDTNITLEDACISLYHVIMNTSFGNGELLAAASPTFGIIGIGDHTSQAAGIIIPQTVAQYTPFVRVQIGNDVYSYVLPEDKEFKSGYKYTYNLAVKKGQKELTLMNNSVEAWTSGGTKIEDTLVKGDEAENTPVENAKETELKAVDLGLPSRTLWANMNLGATDSHQEGSHFQWGEIYSSSLNDCGWGKYYAWSDDEDNPTKYNATDGKTTLDLADDAANVMLGNGWRMPTTTDVQELLDNCTMSLFYIYADETKNTPVTYGYKFTGSNGNYILFPVSWYFCNDRDCYIAAPASRYLMVWTSSLSSQFKSSAMKLYIREENAELSHEDRAHGLVIRPVKNQ